MKVSIELLHEDASQPTKTKSGFWVYSGFCPKPSDVTMGVLVRHLKDRPVFTAKWTEAQPADWVIGPRSSKEINLGFSITLSSPYEVLIQGLDDLATLGIMMIPVIKQGLNGPVTVVLTNNNDVPVIVSPGEPIAHMSIRKAVKPINDIILETKKSAATVLVPSRAVMRTRRGTKKAKVS
jgi:dUTPase